MKKKSSDHRNINYLVLQKAWIVGIVGGVFGTIVWLIMHYFHFVHVRPFIVWEKLFLNKELFEPWYMKLVGIFLNGIISMIIATIYFGLLRRLHHWIFGVLYGIILWLIVYLGMPILFYQYNPFADQTLETHTGFLCFMILYGVFIGYTISFDDEALHRELENN